MSASSILYLAGMAVTYLGRRVLWGHAPWSWVLIGLGVAALAAALWTRIAALREDRADPGLALGRRIARDLTLVGIGSLVLHALGSSEVVARLGLAEQTENRLEVVVAVLWPIVWTCATVPLVVLDLALQSSPVVLPRLRVRQALLRGLTAALGLCWVFPLNYLAARHDHRWDLAYFKTAEPGTATRALVEALPGPVDVRIFLPPSSDVAEPLESYFAALAGPNLRVQTLDPAAEPRLATALKVREPGWLTFTLGEVALDDEATEAAEPAPVTKSLRVGEELDDAKNTLKKLDGEVQKLLVELQAGERIAYATAGHGEFPFRGEVADERKVAILRQLMQHLGFVVRTLDAASGSAEAVPDDADLVLVLGPDQPLLAAEGEALKAYLARGGALLLALEPRIDEAGRLVPTGPDPLDGVLERLGLKLGAGVLASERGIVSKTRAKADRLNVVTDRFSSHPSTAVLSRTAPTSILVTPTAGHLEQVASEAEVTVTVRTLAENWADLDGDQEFDGDAGETKAVRTLAAVSTGTGEGDASFRALVVADASLLSDFWLVKSVGNQQFVADGVRWLIGAEALSGTTESEEDVHIQHTREGEAGWFYATVLGVPVLILGLGLGRLRIGRRRRGGT